MCFVFYRITEVATVIARDKTSLTLQLKIKRERGDKFSFKREYKRYINDMHSSLLYLL